MLLFFCQLTSKQDPVFLYAVILVIDFIQINFDGE